MYIQYIKYKNMYICEEWLIFSVEWVTHETISWKKAKLGHRFYDLSISMSQTVAKALLFLAITRNDGHDTCAVTDGLKIALHLVANIEYRIRG